MSSNHPNKNAEGGEFTSKVSKLGDSVSDDRTSQAKSKPFLERTQTQLIKSEHSEQEMQPKSESTRLEGPDGLVEYQGSNKLKNKKAIITGGE